MNNQNSAQLRYLNDSSIIKSYEGHSGKVNSIVLFKTITDYEFIITGSDDKTIRIFDKTFGTTLRILRGHLAPVTQLKVIQNGKILVSGSDDGNIRLWDINSGQCVSEYKGHNSKITSLAVSEDHFKI